MRLIVAGSRDFNDYDLLKRALDYYLEGLSDIEIVSGKAKGADTLGEQYANERGYKTKEFPANWSLGKKAGYLRNEEMGNYAEACIAFWDGNSKGTNHMISIAKAKNLFTIIVTYGNKVNVSTTTKLIEMKKGSE